MLLSLSVENFLCIRDRVTLDLAAGGSPWLVVGANATGKSSLQKALACLRNLVLGGSRAGQPVQVTPNLFAAASPTRIELRAAHGGHTYTYGFAATTQAILEERLSRQAADGADELLFTRTGGPGQPVHVELGDAAADERKRLDHLVYGTRPEQLFLNEALRRGVRPLTPLGTWLRDRLQLILPEPKIVGLAARATREPGFLAFLDELVRGSGVGLAGLEVEREEVEPDLFESEEEQRELLSALTSFPDAFAETNDGEIIAEAVPDSGGRVFDLYRLRLRCRLAGPPGAGPAELPATELGDGTQRLLHLSQVLYQPPMRPAGGAPVFFIDDLGRSLHPFLANALVRRFLDENGRILPDSERAQMVATAYDRSLVEAGLVAEDRVFEMRREGDGVTLRRA